MAFHYGFKPWEANRLTLYQFRYFSEELAWVQGMGKDGQSAQRATVKQPGEMMSVEELNAMAQQEAGFTITEEKKRQADEWLASKLKGLSRDGQDS